MSTTYVSNIVAILAFVSPMVGIHVIDQNVLGASIQALVGVLALAYTFYGRYKAGGINAFGIRLGN